MKLIPLILAASAFGTALFFAGMNYEKTGCVAIAVALFGCEPH